MLKKLNQSGISPSVEIMNISPEGIWIYVHDKEFFMPFAEFPWFLKATLEQIYAVELLHDKHLHWPLLDVDLDLDSLKNPSLYPLKFS